MFYMPVFFMALLGFVCGQDIVESVERDPIIYYLLNGAYEEAESSTEDNPGPALNGGLWKCGLCEDIGESKLIYSETNVDSAIERDPSLDIQISVTLQGMKCVTVRGNTSGIVKRVVGDCEGPSVTLTFHPAENFVLDVYGRK